MSKGSLIFIFTIILAGMVAFGLYRTGRLDSIIGRDSSTAETQPQLPETKPAQETSPAPEPDPVKKATPAKVEAAPAPVAKPARQEDPARAAYRAKFKAPATGSSITLSLENNTKQTGILEDINNYGVKVKTTTYSLTVPKEKLAPESLAMCYEDQYVEYMMAKASRSSSPARPNKTQVKDDSVKPAANTGEIAEYMRKNGTSDELKERQKRVQEYEAQRIKEGREF